MSHTFCIACPATKEWIWIGQGRGDTMTVLYTGEAATMAKLTRFLNAHRDQELHFTCHDTSDYLFDDGWKEFEACENMRLGVACDG